MNYVSSRFIRKPCRTYILKFCLISYILRVTQKNTLGLCSGRSDFTPKYDSLPEAKTNQKAEMDVLSRARQLAGDKRVKICNDNG